MARSTSYRFIFLPISVVALCSGSLFAQPFQSWILGDTTDFVTENFQPGLVLAGGAGDNDQAMQWMLERAGGGDVLVIRASGSDGYNSYFFDELGVSLNSVETIRFDAPAAATDPYVLRRLEEAELLFIAGGDQYDYYQYWKDNGVETRVNYLANEKGITIGGTSAGMAILGHYYYAPSQQGVIAEEALGNPFHPNMDVLGANDFLTMPFTTNLITDTHFDQRDRAGRLLTFLARLTESQNQRVFGIACNEYTAVCIDENGLARAFGEYPDFEEDLVYFLQVNCATPEILPEIMEPNTPLTWDQNGAAVKVYQLPGTLNGSNTFDLTDWESGTGGSWQDWSAQEGTLVQLSGADPIDCQVTTGTSALDAKSVRWVVQNPVRETVRLEGNLDQFQGVAVLNLSGQQVLHSFSPNFSVSNLPSGIYLLSVQEADQATILRILKL